MTDRAVVAGRSLLYYRESINTGITVYFAKRAGHLKCVIFELFHPHNNINTQSYILYIEQIEGKILQMSCAFCLENSAFQYKWIPCNPYLVGRSIAPFESVAKGDLKYRFSFKNRGGHHKNTISLNLV